MNSRYWMRAGVLALGIMALSGVLRAQEPQEGEAPKPAARGIPSLIDTSAQDNTQQQDLWQPDTTPLTGLSSPTLGRPESRHSYWVPGFEYGANIQSQPGTSGSGSSWYLNNYFGGNLSVQKAWSKSQFAMNYSVGGFVTTQSSTNNSWYTMLGLGEHYETERWQFQWSDQFGYLPETQFGFGNGTGLGLPGVGGPLGPPVGGAGGSTQPNQSIYAAAGPRYSNTALMQATYQLSRRGSITASGAYGLLRFTQPGNVNSDNYVGSLGYNYALTKEDSIGLVYRFSAYHYEGSPQAIGDHIFSVAYGKKITQRLALQLMGGPEINTYRVAVNGNTERISGSANATITYAFNRGSIGATYFHGTSGGSGILIGSDIDQIDFNATRRLTRVWSLHANVGYAKNRPLQQQTGIQGNDYNDWFVGGGIDRPIGRNIDFSLAYQARIEQASAGTCTGSGCSTSTTQNVITIHLQWHATPYVLR